MRIERGNRVRLKVKLEVKGGKVLEESEVAYVHGDGHMLPGLERELEGMEVGAQKSGVIDAKHAFGDESRHPSRTIARKEFPADAKLTVGELFTARGPHGEDVVLRVLALTEESAEVRFMHPLWDKDIEYSVTVLAVSDRTPPPLPADAVAKAEE
jgi:FKBP-type peptidyl-prolyl cis-trans isomerase 2